ncbi:MAG: type VI secretion system tube protein Hcp [Azoarcus sp.]|jgi:type VI secretion system secreted protein Hcp|nr:type VI secretion system tube protein Hcp [Azoarcus sp.]
MAEIYIKIEGITGECKDTKHKNWVEALSLTYGVSQSSSMFTGGGGGVGKADFDSLSFLHYYDRASPNLFKFCAAGKHIPTVEVSLCKSGGGQQEFAHLTLSDVLVMRTGMSGAGGEDIPTELVELSYARIKIAVKEQNADGSVGAETTGSWNVKENKE